MKVGVGTKYQAAQWLLPSDNGRCCLCTFNQTTRHAWVIDSFVSFSKNHFIRSIS